MGMPLLGFFMGWRIFAITYLRIEIKYKLVLHYLSTIVYVQNQNILESRLLGSQSEICMVHSQEYNWSKKMT